MSASSPLPIHVVVPSPSAMALAYAPSPTMTVTPSAFLGVANFVQTIGVPESHPHDQTHRQPNAMIDDGSMSLVFAAYLAAWAYRRLG